MPVLNPNRHTALPILRWSSILYLEIFRPNKTKYPWHAQTADYRVITLHLQGKRGKVQEIKDMLES